MAIPLEPRVRIANDENGTYRAVLIEPEALAAKIGGVDLLLHFQACFNGANKLEAYSQVLEFSQEKLGFDGVEGYRNLWTLATAIAGTMHEIHVRLGVLRGELKAFLATTPDAWKPLADLQKRWQEQRLGKAARNQWAFHLGDHDIYQTGWPIAVASHPREMPFFSKEKAPPHGIYFELASDLVIRGVGESSSVEDLKTFAGSVREQSNAFPRLIQELFMRVLRKSGVSIEGETP